MVGSCIPGVESSRVPDKSLTHLLVQARALGSSFSGAPHRNFLSLLIRDGRIAREHLLQHENGVLDVRLLAIRTLNDNRPRDILQRSSSALVCSPPSGDLGVPMRHCSHKDARSE
jgi:hypothetical protein